MFILWKNFKNSVQKNEKKIGIPGSDVRHIGNYQERVIRARKQTASWDE